MHQIRKHFSIAYFVTAIAVIIIDPLLQMIAKISLPNDTGIIELIPAIFYAGYKFAEDNNTMPESRVLWRTSLELSLISTAISLVLTAALVAAFSGTESMSEIDSLFNDVPIWVVAGALIFATLLYTPVIRFILPFAIRSRWRSLKR